MWRLMRLSPSLALRVLAALAARGPEGSTADRGPVPVPTAEVSGGPAPR
jgi:hypothetical protein